LDRTARHYYQKVILVSHMQPHQFVAKKGRILLVNPQVLKLVCPACLEGKKAEQTSPRKSTSRTLKRVDQQYRDVFETLFAASASLNFSEKSTNLV
jgi:hypothetical protein